VLSTTHPEPRLRGRREEREALLALLAGARAGSSGVLVLRGQPGIGKTALLEYLIAEAVGFRITRVTGVESEVELAFGGLHQLCGPFLDEIQGLPEPQRNALGTAFGLNAGQAPDRFLVGLGVLTLLAGAAEAEPVVCVIDDAQWLDRVSAQTVAFVGRRLLAERIALVVAVREPIGTTEFSSLPQLALGGLKAEDAEAVLDSVVGGPMDRRVRDRILAEAGGNPLALLELPRTWTTAELADVLSRPIETPLAGRLEEAFARQLAALPSDSRRLLVTAAAEPLGDAALLWRAAAIRGLGPASAAPAEAAGLIEFGDRIRFRHPLVRAAAYRAASIPERHEAHGALAEATDADIDPDRRAWHRSLTTVVPDEAIAAELERAAGRARARGGSGAAAALLERSAHLTPDPTPRARRSLAAAWAKRDAGQLEAALALLAETEGAPPGALRAGEVAHLSGQIAFDQRRGTDAARLLLDSAKQLEPVDGAAARETYLDALTAAIWASGPDATDIVALTAAAGLSAPPAPRPPRAVDIVLDALATRSTEGFVPAHPLLARALGVVRDLRPGTDEAGRLLGLGGSRVSAVIATDLWDFVSARELAERQVRSARDAGAPVELQFALNVLATNEILSGNLASAADLIEEARNAADAIGNAPVTYAAMLLTAYRGQEQVASQLIRPAREEATVLGDGRITTFADYSSAVLQNALGRHDLALTAARRVVDRDVVGGYQVMAVAELAEAASRTGDRELLAKARMRSSERARLTGTDWSLGIDARLAAFAGDGDADDRHRESIDRLERAGLRVEVARGHLLYGEWLRREGRRVDARDPLRAAYDQSVAMGLGAITERARNELLATGEKVRKRSVETADMLTAQEFQIARLARDGLSNTEIGTRLFLSPRTVEWHLGKVFSKLEVTSRRQLRTTELELGPAYTLVRPDPRLGAAPN
jgi:DNA-binding CsgD family transcriptional regulator